MSLFVNQEAANRLTRQLHGGYTELCVSWEERAVDDPQFPKAPAESTLRRWLLHGLPTRKSNKHGAGMEFFALSALLDVDPLVLFDFERNGYFSKFTTMRKMLFAGFGFPSSLAPLIEMYGPEESWPNDQLCRRFYGRGWFSAEFNNIESWQHNNYAAVSLKMEDRRSMMPNAVHVAYRRAHSPDSLWRYYGSVLRLDSQVYLYNESGDHQCVTDTTIDRLAFRTYFGGRPVEWRVASLFEFSHSVKVPCADERLLTFTW